LASAGLFVAVAEAVFACACGAGEFEGLACPGLFAADADELTGGFAVVEAAGDGGLVCDVAVAEAVFA
jgi:hypothetical protein